MAGNRTRVRTIVITSWDRYNPSFAAISSGKRGNFASEPLKWVRLQSDWFKDLDIVDLAPSVRSLWPALIAMAGANIPHGQVRTSVHRLAREVHLDEGEVALALAHLWKRGRIRYSPVRQSQTQSGYVPTYLRTDVPTDKQGDFEKKNDGARGDASWIQDPDLRRLVEIRRGRGA